MISAQFTVAPHTEFWVQVCLGLAELQPNCAQERRDLAPPPAAEELVVAVVERVVVVVERVVVVVERVVVVVERVVVVVERAVGMVLLLLITEGPSFPSHESSCVVSVSTWL